MRVVIGVAEKVRVVRRDDGDPRLRGEIEHERVELRLQAAGIVGLDFEIVAIREGIGIPARDPFRLFEPPFQQVRRDLAGDAGGGDDEPLGILGEELAVDARLRVEALRVREGRELDEIAIPDRVTGEEHEVIVRLAAVPGPRPLAPIARGDVGLHADDRLDAGLFRFLLEVPGAVQIAVIGDGEGGLFELLRAADQVADSIGAIEQRIFGMTVEMDE